MKITKTPLGSTLLVLCFVFSLFAYPSAAHAAGTVGTGTPASCTEAALDTALSGGGSVDFDCGAAPHTIVVTSPKIISDSTVIDGGGLITLSGGNTVRIFEVQAGFTLSLTDISLVNGYTPDLPGYIPDLELGGAIYVNGGATVNITDSTLANNTSDFDSADVFIAGGAGAIHNAGTLNISGSTFSGNSAAGPGGDGGAIFSSGTLNVSNSTFYNNSASPGTPGSTGSAMRINGGTATITHVTISDNQHSVGYGALDVSSGTVTLSRSILANSLSGFDCRDQAGTVTSTSNLIETDSGTDPCTAAIAAPLSLGALQDNGGPTQTMALVGPGNPARDAGGAACGVATDQRGVARPQPGGNCDLGAFEVDSALPTVTVDQASGQADPTSASPVNFTAVFSEPIDTATFTAADVTLGGTAPGTLSATITQVAPNNDTTFNIAVSGMTGSGTVTASIAANRVEDIAGNDNLASTSTDNSVTYDDTFPTVVATSLVASYTTGPNTFTVTFNKDVSNAGGGTGPDDVENPVNYLLVEDGANGAFDTVSCAGGLQADDTQVAVDSVSYNSGLLTSTLGINGGTALPDGSYRLFVCGTTSIVDLLGNQLNNGASDYSFSFVVQAGGAGAGPAGAGGAEPKTLPATGFPRGVVTKLPAQPAEKVYASTDLVLEIPALGQKLTIVGVPQSEGSWDVTWLGNSAGYLAGSAFPTWSGNTVITGHVWDALNQPGPFAELKTLKYGDQFYIHAWGLTYTYEVRENRYLFPFQVRAVFQPEDYDWVTLLTCEYYNVFKDNYLFRRMVRAVLVSVD